MQKNKTEPVLKVNTDIHYYDFGVKEVLQWTTGRIISYERKTWWTLLGNNIQNLPIANTQRKNEKCGRENKGKMKKKEKPWN